MPSSFILASYNICMFGFSWKGMEYTTTVIEAIGVEHKETTRNYDILAAAFTDVLNNLHNDYGLIEE